MLITITTTSQKLSDILTENQKSTGILAKNNLANIGNSKDFDIFIQNLGTQDIYIDFGTIATILGGGKIQANTGVIQVNTGDLSVINLISDSSNNTNVRILIK